MVIDTIINLIIIIIIIIINHESLSDDDHEGDPRDSQMPPFLREAMLFIYAPHREVLEIRVKLCPAEYADIFWSHVNFSLFILAIYSR